MCYYSKQLFGSILNILLGAQNIRGCVIISIDSKIMSETNNNRGDIHD